MLILILKKLYVKMMIRFYKDDFAKWYIENKLK